MPWQTLPSFGIIIVAFSAAGGLVHGIQKAVMREDREVLRDNYSYGMQIRDDRVFAYRKMTEANGGGPSVAETENALQKQLEELRKSM